jgi:Cd2+/Zn2+-exporting ATPase
MSAERSTTVQVEELCCAVEEQKIRDALAKIPGVRRLQFDLSRKTVKVDHAVEPAVLVVAIRKAGMTGRMAAGSHSTHDDTPTRRIILVSASTLLLIAGAVVEHWLAQPVAASALYLVSIAGGGWEIVVRAIRALARRQLNVNVLMSAAAIGAVALGDHAEGAAVLVLYSLSLLLESLSIDRTRRAIAGLLSLAPATATIKTADGRRRVPASDVQAGDTIIILPGDRIPLDGRVTGGISSVNQSAVTGESMPVFKEAGDMIYAGSLNGRGSLEVLVSSASEDTLLHRIAEHVQTARDRKGEVQSRTERIAKFYVPGVFAAALLMAIVPPLVFDEPFADWFYRALTMLVISCPCAFLLSTPMAVVSALTAGSRAGVLIRSGSALEALARVSVVAVDKTGTLTHGRHEVVTVRPMNGVSVEELLRITAILEARSEHPLADALLRYAARLGVFPEESEVRDFTAVPGKGLRAQVDGRPYVLGNHVLIEESGLCSTDLEQEISELESRGETVLVLSDGSRALGIVGLKDVARRESASTVAEIGSITGAPVVLISGDHEQAAQRLAREVGIRRVHAGVLPEAKATVVQQLRREYGPVAMVGDGLNDAPALATADVGIAMGGSGSEAAIDAADVVLMQNRFSMLPSTLRLARSVRSVILFNMILALGAKGASLLLGAAGQTSLWWAVLADDGVTLLVLLNSLRLLRFGRREPAEHSEPILR